MNKLQNKPIPIFQIMGESNKARHLPLALGMIRAQVQFAEEGRLAEFFRFIPSYGMDLEELVRICRAFGPGVWLFSDYIWTVDHCLKVSKAIKKSDCRNITIHGGPNAPKYQEACQRFLIENPHVDFIVRGEGEVTALALLSHIATHWGEDIHRSSGLEEINGISYALRAGNDFRVMRTADRARLMDVNQLYSPYLTGVFDKASFRAAMNDDVHLVHAATIESNRGCPYKCTFCDWGSLTAQKIAQFDIERVEAEIDWVGRHHIPVLHMADANFGIFPRDLDIARMIAKTKETYGFPLEVAVSYSKNGNERQGQIVKTFLDAGLTSQGVISIQTRDTETLKVIERTNIRNDNYDRLASFFKEEKMPLATELMIGLPGSTVESLKQDLQFYFDNNITVRAFQTRMLMNSPMADPEYRKKYSIKVNADDYLISTFSYTEEDMRLMCQIYAAYRFLITHSTFVYVIKYLQWDHGIQALQFVHDLVRFLGANAKSDEDYACIYRLPPPDPVFPIMKYVFQHCEQITRGLRKFVQTQYGLDSADACFDDVVKVNEAVLPNPQKSCPLNLQLQHDVVAYYEVVRKANGAAVPKLASFGPGTIEIADPFGICALLAGSSAYQYNFHQVFCELQSPLRMDQSKPHWLDG